MDHGFPHRHPPPPALGQEHAADHQGHEDGRGGQAAARAGTRRSARAPTRSCFRSVLAKVAAHAGEVTHPLLEAREEKRVIVVTIAGDRGLAGAFNTNVNKATIHLLASHPEWTEVRILPIGKKAVEFWRRRKYPADREDLLGHFRHAPVCQRERDRRVSVGGVSGAARGRGVRRRQRVPVDPVAGRAHRKAAAVVPRGRRRARGADVGRRLHLRARRADDPGLAPAAVSGVHDLSRAARNRRPPKWAPR